MHDDSTMPARDAAIHEASTIAMERYELDESGALALLSRLARRHRVELPIVAAAVVAAALARRSRSR